ncbi:hypothetical protein, partial [Pseudomonas viridiflava]
TPANGDIGWRLRSLAAVELRTSTSQLSALPVFSQVGFMERLRLILYRSSHYDHPQGLLDDSTFVFTRSAMSVGWSTFA